MSETDIKFNGSNWQALNQLVALARFHFTMDDDFTGNAPRQCSWLASRFEGPALDWVAAIHTSTPATFNSFEGFITAVRQAFGVAENNINALLRRELDQLVWQQNVPVFFANFDRLTLALGITSHETRVVMVEAKLPTHIKNLFAEQALSFSNYDTMRERLNMMWALKPSLAGSSSASVKKPRCGSCGKKGHQTSDCRGSKN